MHRRSTRRQASSNDQGEQQKRVDSDGTTGGGQLVKQKQRPRAGCVRAGDDVSVLVGARRQLDASQCCTMASAQSAPKMCVTCEHAPTRPHAARTQRGRQGRHENYERGGLPEGQRNSREAENTDDAKEHRGAKHKTIA